MRTCKTRSLSCLLAVAVAAVGIPVLLAQNRKPPTHRDVAYDKADNAQRLDAYLVSDSKTAVPVIIHIHGGGWRGGSKSGVPSWLLDGVEAGKWTVASVEYRFTNVEKHPAQVNDCLRAIQFVRSHAKEWNIDPTRVAVTGGSAGGHLSLWVALHDDIADPQASDPVKQQSSRVKCAISFAGPTDWSLLGKIDHKHPAYRQLLGYEPGTPAGQMDARQMEDVSPIHFVSSDDPPIMQVHGDKDDIVPIEHAQTLNERLKKANVRSELVVIPGANHGVAGAAPNVSQSAIRFADEILTPTANEKVPK